MRCKIVRFQKLMWRNMMRSTKSQKTSVLYYSIDYVFSSCTMCYTLEYSNPHGIKVKKRLPSLCSFVYLSLFLSLTHTHTHIDVHMIV